VLAGPGNKQTNKKHVRNKRFKLVNKPVKISEAESAGDRRQGSLNPGLPI